MNKERWSEVILTWTPDLIFPNIRCDHLIGAALFELYIADVLNAQSLGMQDYIKIILHHIII